IVSHVDPTRLVLLLPFQGDEYETFRARSAIFPHGLPEYFTIRAWARGELDGLSLYALVRFDEDWTPHLVKLDRELRGRLPWYWWSRQIPIETYLRLATRPVLDRLGLAAGEHPLQSRWLRRSAIMKSAFMVAVVGLLLTAIVVAVLAPDAGRAIHRWMTDRGWWCRLVQPGRSRRDPLKNEQPNSATEPGDASDMRLYNTQTAALESFQASGGSASLYVCGITPYDTTHLGHAFTYATADVLVRYLESQGIAVRYVQNVTDIDDDILGKERELGEDGRAVGNRGTAHFIDDMHRLNISPPDHSPRASDFVPEIVTATGALIERGLAYVSGGNVYYAVGAWPAFGRLSHLPRSVMLAVANERGNRPDDPHKRDPLDFVLWQAQAPGEPAWPSPWGPGRP